MTNLQDMFDDNSAHKFYRTSDDVRKKISEAVKAVKGTPEARALISARSKEANNRPEVKAKLSAAHKGKIVKASTGAKISESKLKLYQCPWGQYKGRDAAARAGGISVSYFEKKLRSDPKQFYEITGC